MILQLTIILMVAAIVSLLSVKAYPLSKALTRPGNLQSSPSQKTTLGLPTGSKTSPTSISIPALNLLLPIAAATISGNQWALHEDKVSWLVTSEVPGQGNAILYAHNKPSLFGKLSNLVLGDTIVVEHAEKTHHYEVTEKRSVLPYEVEAVLAKSNQLTLYTCEGTFDQKRLVVIARPL